jgi:4-aminobutyrate aminotransferase-like enzyme
VQSGVGRTGEMWASELTPGLDVDILVTAKGIASGYPLSAVRPHPPRPRPAPAAHRSVCTAKG